MKPLGAKRQKETSAKSEGNQIWLKYPTSSDNTPRYTKAEPHRHIQHFLRQHHASFRTLLDRFHGFLPQLKEIATEAPEDSTAACFVNPYFPVLDAIALYCLLAIHRPKRLIEVGSGYSTRMARRSISDHNLSTRLISIDPQPRSYVDEICDEVVRKPLEAVDLAMFDRLRDGDFLFIDNSHRSFMNSDVTVCFLDVIPRLRKGVFVQLHDIFWPFDYPENWKNRYYNEQYLLGALLVQGLPNFDVVLSNAYVSSRPKLRTVMKDLWVSKEMQSSLGGASFWMRRNTDPVAFNKRR